MSLTSAAFVSSTFKMKPSCRTGETWFPFSRELLSSRYGTPEYLPHSRPQKNQDKKNKKTAQPSKTETCRIKNENCLPSFSSTKQSLVESKAGAQAETDDVLAGSGNNVQEASF